MTRKVIRRLRVATEAVGEVLAAAADVAIDVAQNMRREAGIARVLV